MTIQTILQRKLTPRGCIAVAQSLADNWGILREQGITPPPEVETAAERVYDAGDNLAQLGGDDSMANVDQGTDRMIAGFFGIFSARELCYTTEQILPLSPEEKDWFRLSYKTKLTLFPNGTKFVQEPHETQWKHLQRLQDLLNSQEIQAALYSLSLTAEASRLLRWIELYGVRIGALQGQREQQVRAALAAFYEAWDYFMVEVMHAYRDHSPESNHATNALLSV